MTIERVDGSGGPAETALVRHLEAVERSAAGEVDTRDMEELRNLLGQLFAELGYTNRIRRNYGRGASGSVLFWEEARWLLEASRSETPESAVSRLRAFVKKNESSFLHVVLFWGMHPPAMLQVAEGFKLGPLDALPPSEPRRYFLGESISDADRRTTEFVSHYPKPRALFLREMSLKPIYEDESAPPQPFTWDDKYFMADLLHVLPIVTRSGVIRIAEWQQWPPDEPVVSLGTGWGWSSHAQATHEIPKTPYDEMHTGRLVRSYLSLDSQSRNRLRLPLRRLNAAFLSESLANRAIELGVALEALLTQPEDPTEGITHRVAVRAARLIGSGLSNRKEIVGRVKKLYGLRSIAAHGVDVDEVTRERRPSGMPRQFRDVEEIVAVLDDGSALISDVVEEILKLGAFPEYNDLELSSA